MKGNCELHCFVARSSEEEEEEEGGDQVKDKTVVSASRRCISSDASIK